MEVNIYNPNPAIEAVLKSARMRSIVFEVAEVAQALYVAQVAKRTGMLAASAHVSTEIGGIGVRKNDRWIGVLTVGGTGSKGTVEYAAAHEFGTHEGAPTESNRYGTPETVGAEDLNRVLEELGGL